MDSSLFAHIPSLSGIKAPQIDHEFQAVCLECEEFFGKSDIIWTLPYKKGVTENLIRYALKECKTRDKPLPYFLKIIHNKKK